MSRPPIPTRCADRPLAGGLVVPHVSVVAGGRPVLGSVHGTKVDRCILNRLCQVCGQRLGRPLVVLATTAQLETQHSGEAALHPECARYSALACPMLAGNLATYRASDRHIGTACDLPGCDCDGWVSSGPHPGPTRGDAATEWHAVWLNDYDAAVTSEGVPNGLSWARFTPIRIRPVQRAADRQPAAEES